jgi:signal transduction histidine kinase
MIESAKSQNEVPIETSILKGAVPLESILCTDELHRRQSRLPDYEKENHALVLLASALADSPLTILQALAETILDITQSDSAGLSLLTKDAGGQRFYWPAIAGVWKPHVGGGTPRNFGPCGDVLDCNRTLLFKHFERRYPYLTPVMPPAEECLLVPFYVERKAVGTIWAIMHSDRRKFDAEDDRVMGSLGKFASSAYQTLLSIDHLKFQVAEREKAETELHELTDGLERQVRMRTAELEHRNRQLAEAQTCLTEEKLALERSEAYLAEAQRISRSGSWHWNITTGEVFWSKEFFAIFGFDPHKDTPSYSSFVERIHPEDRSKTDEARRAAIREKRCYEAEYRILLPGDLIKYVHSLGHCSVSQSGDVEFIGAIMDITERKRAEEEREELRHSLAELAHINRVSTMGELTASLAHEIKQPIAAAVADAETCLLWLTPDRLDAAEAQAAASRLMKGVTRASDIINRIGLLFRKDVPERELVDVNGVIQEMIALLGSEASRYSIAIRSELANGLPKIMADRVALQQVFMNLMLNGIEAMKDMAAPGKLTITSSHTENRELLVLISDTGVGLRPEQAEQVFNPFYTSKPEGTGMGLPISRSIIESHGGRLWVTSIPGPGATFQFSLPIEVASHGS